MFVITDEILFRRCPQFVQTVVSDLQDPAGCYDAVGRFEVSVTVQICFVQVHHAFEQVIYHRGNKDSFQFDVVVLQNVLDNK